MKITRYIKNNKILVPLVLISAFVFYYGSSNGSIQSTYEDETYFDLYALKIIYYMMGHGISYQLDPPFYSICLAIAFSIYYLFSLLIGHFSNVNDLIVEFSTHREVFITIGRLVSASFALATVPLIYWLTEKLYANKRAAILATLGFCVSYPVIWFAHTMHHTTISIFISVLIICLSYKVMKRGKLIDYIYAGIAIGLGIGIKIYPGVYVLSLFAAHIYRFRELKKNVFIEFYKIFLCGIFAIVFLFIAYPWPIIEHSQWSEWTEHAYVNAFFNGGSFWNNLYYVIWGKSEYYSNTSAEPFSFWSNSLRIVSESTLIFFAFGLAYTFLYKRKIFMFLMPAFFIFLFHHCIRGGLAYGARQFYFLLPSFYIISSGAIIELIDKVFKSKAKVIAIFFSILILLQPIIWAKKYLSLIGNPTTLEIGRNWLDKNIPQNSAVLVNYCAPYANTTGWFAPDSLLNYNKQLNTLIKEARDKIKPHFCVISLHEEDFNKEILMQKSTYENVYIALSDYNSTAYYQFDNAKLWGLHKYWKAPQKEKYFNAIYSHSKLVYTIMPREFEALGPVISIYKLN